jgi:hypothetical protein
VRYVEFLRVALGVFRADEAVHNAAVAAASAGRDCVDWEEIANSVPMPVREAQGIVDRLRGSTRGQRDDLVGQDR